ncbi:MAG: glutamine synthetase III [Spirochaetaceae bacterium]|jgi:glutamine synthetase|nr:glutamine synthetase III [Spirochaetaceae bacterium]
MDMDFHSSKLEKIYGINCFGETEMMHRLPKNIFKELKAVQMGKQKMTLGVAEVVAGAMKDWAIQKGATHFTHWFQPLTGTTAEKHDSFISPTTDGDIIMEFSGKELIQGEPDASSFPSGGLRATFEARGYTAWDVTSPAFLKHDRVGLTLCIPTAFVSYTGEALDKKVPLLRSMEAVNLQALRILRLLGNQRSQRVVSNIGPEQEYFLIDKAYFDLRPDLRLCGRTVFGSMCAKGQEMDDHYFGAIKDRVADYMRELNIELWKLGVSAKTQHNEVAPNQFELATVYSSSNVATDTNHLVMETMSKVAKRLDMVCLLHEKPYAGVNGSGKHNNWSLNTDDGINLLKPGHNPQDNVQFLLFLVATIKAVDEYAELLRISASNSGNDHRLGANEAPPAIISIFLGEEIHEILDKLSKDETVISKEGGSLKLGTNSLPDLPLDMTDRNRTSPFAFTGNKFEFRMVGSSQSIAGPNVVLNTAVAEALCQMADKLEASKDLQAEITKIVKDYYLQHKRVLFNGNGYSQEWVDEAEKRGLPNIPSTVDALPELLSDKSVKLFSKHKVLSKVELESRLEIYLEIYSMQINIEAGVMHEMAQRQITPAVLDYMADVAQTAQLLIGQKSSSNVTSKILGKFCKLSDDFYDATEALEQILKQAASIEDTHHQARAYRDLVIPAMAKLRDLGDDLEKIMPKDCWPFPGYQEMLFYL